MKEVVIIELLNVKGLIRSGKIFSVYQPLLSTKNDSIFAYEALMRTSPKMNPVTIFKHARKSGDLYQLDTHCILNAMKYFPKSFFKKYFLFINIFPSTIAHEKFDIFLDNLLSEYSKFITNIVFEINECKEEASIWKQSIFLNRLVLLKKLGCQIAFDDLTISKSSLLKMERLLPDFVKLDYSKGKNLSKSNIKQQLVSLFLDYTNENMKLVLEGIEKKEDLLVAKKLGVPLLQGYYISKPIRL